MNKDTLAIALGLIGGGVLLYASTANETSALRANQSDASIGYEVSAQYEAERIRAESELAKLRIDSGMCRQALNPIADGQQALNPDGSIVSAKTCLVDAHGTTGIVGNRGKILELATLANNHDTITNPRPIGATDPSDIAQEP